MRISILRSAFILVAASGLAGCGTMADPTEWFEDTTPKNPPAKLLDLENKIAPRVLWSASVGDIDETNTRSLRPKVSGDRIYFADAKGVVEARDVQTGDRVWRVELERTLSGGPGQGEGLVLVGTPDATVIALDAGTGEKRWESAVSSEVLVAPAAGAGVVVVHTGDGKVIGLAATTGKERWRYDRPIPVLSLRGSSEPLINGNSVFVGMAGGKLLAFDIARGQVQWEVLVSIPTGATELDRISDIDGDLFVKEGVVYVATFQGEVAAVGEFSGQLLWRRKLPSDSGVTADWRQAYASDNQGRVWALDINGGNSRWRQEKLNGRGLSGPAVLGEYVVVGDFEGYLHWLSAQDGEIVARTRQGNSAIIAQPRVVDGRLFVTAADGDLEVIALPDK